VRWRARPPTPTARSRAAIGGVNKKLYVRGGRLRASFIGVASNADVAEEHDPATDSWGAVRARMPTARSAGAWGAYGGRIYVAGGERKKAQLRRGVRALEGGGRAANTWRARSPMPTARTDAPIAVASRQLHG